MKEIKKKIQFILQEGFFHIFGAQALNKLVRFGASVIIVSLLSKEVYGRYSYAANILEFFLLLSGLGVVSGILQFSSEKKDISEKLSFLKYGTKIGFSFNLLIIISIILFTLFFSLPIKGSDRLLLMMAFLPIFAVIHEISGSFLRSTFRNKEFSYVSISYTLVYFLGVFLGGYFFQVYGIIGSRYVSFIVSILIASYFLKNDIRRMNTISSPQKRERHEFIRFSLIACLTNSASQILLLLDIFLIGLIIKDELVVATYKIATLIPFALFFIPRAIMVFAYPYFASFINDKRKAKQYFYEMQKYLVFFNLFISLGLIIFAPLLIRILFGSEYHDSILPFRILCVGYFIAGSFAIPGGNVLASMRKININFLNSVFCGVLNIILDIFLILKFGAVGAAIATATVFTISSLISNGYLFMFFKRHS